MKKKHKHDYLQTLHPMSSFGVVSGLINQIRVTRLEKRLNPAVPFPHKHSFYHVVLIKKGSGWHEIDFKRHEVLAGTLFFMKPSQVHSWSMKKDTTGIVIEFENLQFIVNEGLIPENINDHFLFSSNISNKINSLAQNMLEEYESEKKDFEVILRSELASLIVLCTRHESNRPEGLLKISKFREDFNEMIENNFRKHHDVIFYAKLLKMTSKALTSKVNRNYGKSVRDIIQERCILESKRLLAYSDLSISEISLELGFEDPNYFTRFFKLKTNINPGKFRQKVRALC